MGSGLGSPEILPSVLEHGAANVNSSLLGQADDAFLLQPTPRGMKNYCIIQRTRSVVVLSIPAVHTPSAPSSFVVVGSA